MENPRQIPTFKSTGAHVLVDGQYGSTGKGALAAFLANEAVKTGAIDNFAGVISSAGPNSGHTSYFNGQKIVLKQLPTFAVHAHLLGHTVPIYLSAGAIIDKEVLRKEAEAWSNIPIYVHPNAAVVTEQDRTTEILGPIATVAGTRSGTGAALIRKIERRPDAVWRERYHHDGGIPFMSNVVTMSHFLHPEDRAYFVEVAQGFSLGINSEFYPKVTSRECTVMQAIADARIPPRHVAVTYMCIRTYPIRVGDVDGYSSGDWYQDQTETSWDRIGVTPELTTVTQRIRRVATFSEMQVIEAIRANDPDWLAVNFLNYLDKEGQEMIIEDLRELPYTKPFGIIGGWGQNVEDWEYIK